MSEFSEEAKNFIWSAVHTTPAADIRVFLPVPDPDAPAATGIDALLTTPGILAEFFRRRALNRPFGESDAGSAHESYIRSLTPGELADIVWRQLFIDHAPLSEATRCVLTTLGLYGIDVGSGDLRALREQFDAIPDNERLERALTLANLDLVLHPVDVMDMDRAARPAGRSPAFRPVLDLSSLLGDWKESARTLRGQGYGLKAKVDEFTPLELRRFLNGAVMESRPAALGIDWPLGHYPDDNCVGRLVREAVMPLCRERGLPLLVAADGADTAAGLEAVSIIRLAPLWEENQEVRFLLFPAREEQLPSALLASQRCRNLLLCGPDQPLANPTALDRFTIDRLEATGSAFHACHSSAESPEELVGRWAHMRWVFGKALIRRYADLWRTGWRFADSDIRRDVKAMLGGNARNFLGL